MIVSRVGIDSKVALATMPQPKIGQILITRRIDKRQTIPGTKPTQCKVEFQDNSDTLVGASHTVGLCYLEHMVSKL